MELRTPTGSRSHEGSGRIDAAQARAIADDFLIMKVGDLLTAGEPRLTADDRWLMSITLGNVVQGTLGEVGTIAVDAMTGEVQFSEAERARLEARAWELSGASPP
jgi:hypothetical protein